MAKHNRYHAGYRSVSTTQFVCHAYHVQRFYRFKCCQGESPEQNARRENGHLSSKTCSTGARTTAISDTRIEVAKWLIWIARKHPMWGLLFVRV
jgi:hypothetical protein